MRSILLGIIVLVLAAGFASAENDKKASKPPEGIKKVNVVKLRGGLYSKMYLKTYYKSRQLKLDVEQRYELKEQAKKYANIIKDEENKSRRLQRDFMKQLESYPFDFDKLKAIATEIMDANTKAIDNFIFGIAEIERIIGPENFAKLTPISKFDRKSLAQLKEGSAESLLEDKDLKSGKPQGEAGKK